MLSHAAIHAQSLAKLATIGYGPIDTYLHLAPLFHVGGLSSAHAALMAGCAQARDLMLACCGGGRMCPDGAAAA